MTYECQLKEIKPQPTLSIRGHTSVAAISTTIGEFLGEVWNYIQQQGGQPAGPPFTRYHSVAGDAVDLEAGLPLAQAMVAAGRIRAGELPGGEVISTYHFGPYENLPAAGAALKEWVQANNREEAGPNWEIYWTDPGAVSNPQEWKTEVVKPLKAATRKHTHQIELPASPDEVFAMLHRPSAIRAWWSADRAVAIPEPNGIWAAAWGSVEDDPEYVAAATIKVFDPPHRLLLAGWRYYAKQAPLPFQADLTTEFTVHPTPTGSLLQVVQDGFPAAAVADDFYAACEKGWQDTFASIGRYVAGNAAHSAGRGD